MMIDDLDNDNDDFIIISCFSFAFLTDCISRDAHFNFGSIQTQVYFILTFADLQYKCNPAEGLDCVSFSHPYKFFLASTQFLQFHLIFKLVVPLPKGIPSS